MPTTIYTVITGAYDSIKQPLVVEEGVEYVLFTNNPEIKDGGVWEVVQIPHEQWTGRTERDNNILLSRRVKLLAHEYLPKGEEWSVYVDADMVIKGSLTELISGCTNETLFAACRHSYCKSVQEEIEDLLSKNMVEPEQVKQQWNKYVEWGFRDDLGISENGLLIRKHNDRRVQKLMELWWSEYETGCLRDQVSLIPCIYKADFMPYFQFVEKNIRDNEYLEVLKHL